jgi:hypothetical protein
MYRMTTTVTSAYTCPSPILSTIDKEDSKKTMPEAKEKNHLPHDIRASPPEVSFPRWFPMSHVQSNIKPSLPWTVLSQIISMTLKNEPN